MRKHNHVMLLWRYMELSEKKRLMNTFARKHGANFSPTEFFEFLSDEYDDSQISFEVIDGDTVKEKAAA